MENTRSVDDDFLIEITGTDVFIKDKQILSAIDWTLRPNENWAVVGNNGAGKTTFLRLLSGELIPSFGGTVYWFGQRTLENIWNIKSRIGFVSAEYQASYDRNITAAEVVLSGLFSSIGLYEKPTPSQRKAALAEMEFLGIAHLVDKQFHGTSYGEARRIMLARALVNKPEILVLDEPCAGLDIPTKELFLETLETLSKRKTRLIYVTHHIEEIIPAITHVLHLKQGRIMDQGRKQEMLKNKLLSDNLDCCITLSNNHGRYWITGCRAKKLPGTVYL